MKIFTGTIYSHHHCFMATFHTNLSRPVYTWWQLSRFYVSNYLIWLNLHSLVVPKNLSLCFRWTPPPLPALLPSTCMHFFTQLSLLIFSPCLYHLHLFLSTVYPNWYIHWMPSCSLNSPPDFLSSVLLCTSISPFTLQLIQVDVHLSHLPNTFHCQQHSIPHTLHVFCPSGVMIVLFKLTETAALWTFSSHFSLL